MAIHAVGNAGLDDALFVHQARTLGAGLWLGTFDDTTLVKGMVYPLFLLGAFMAGIPLKLAEQGVYLAAAAGAALLVARAERRAWPGTLLFIALAFSPVVWTVELSRVMREGLYLSLSLAVIALLVALLRPAAPGQPGRGWVRRLMLGVLLGLLAGAFWLTREEGIWLLPAAATVVLAALLSGRVTGLLPLLPAALGFALVLGAVTGMNWRTYGVAETVEVNAPSFKHAYGALSRIVPDTWRRYVVLSQDASARLYAVSPAARALQPVLDGPVGQSWRQVGCHTDGAADCSEILSSWFQWALRDAVTSAGYYQTATGAQAYYEQLAAEIDAACASGALHCLPPRATLLPPFRWGYVMDALRAAPGKALILLRAGGDTVKRLPSAGPEEQIDAFEDTVGQVNRAARIVNEATGWIGTPGGPPQIAVRPAALTDTRTDIVLSPAPDLAARYPGLHLTKFLISTTCALAECDVVLSVDGQTVAVIPMTELGAPGRVERAGYTMEVERAGEHIFRRAKDRRDALILRLVQPVGRLYALALPVLAAVGVAGLGLTLLRRRRAAFGAPVFVLALASLVAVVCRVALVAYMEVTSIPSVGVLYLAAATPFVIVLAVLGSWLLYRGLRPGVAPLP